MSKKRVLQFDHKDVKIYEKKTRYQGFFKLEEYQISHQNFDGRQSNKLTREIFERGDAVVVIPYDPKTDQVLLLEQFRPGAIRANDTPWMLEFIAGMFSENEKPIDVAIRESQEEANLDLSSKDISFVMKYLSSPGGMSEAIYLYLAKINLTGEHYRFDGDVFGLPEEGEDILVHVFKREEAMQLLAKGKIVNAATIIGLQWLALNYQEI